MRKVYSETGDDLVSFLFGFISHIVYERLRG